MNIIGVIFADGCLWKDQRKFMTKALKEIQTAYKPFGEHIMDELKIFTEYLSLKEVSIFRSFVMLF